MAMASMINTKDMSILVRKKGLALTVTGSNEAQYIYEDVLNLPAQILADLAKPGDALQTQLLLND